MRFVYVDIFLYLCIMNDEDFRGRHFVLYGVYGNRSVYTSDVETWYNSIRKSHYLIHSIRNLNKCGVEVDYSNRNEIVHGQK